MTLAAAATIALSSAGYAQTLPMTCDATNMENLKADVKKAPSDAQKSAAQAAIGDATMAMQAGKVDDCVMAMQKARMAIDTP